MMKPEELVAYMEEVAAQCPDHLLDGDVYTMVHFGIELAHLAELEKLADSVFRLNQHHERLVTLLESTDRRGGFGRR